MGRIRLLLALSVISAHCGPIFGLTMLGGQFAVQCFFIISGFYMSLVINEKYIGANNSYSLFITNRMLRLMPIYWAVGILTLLYFFLIHLTSANGVFPFFDSYSKIHLNSLSFSYLLLSNLLVLGQDISVFLGINPASGHLFFTTDFWTTHPPVFSFMITPQAWTLSLEIYFYLLAPFILRKGFKLVAFLMLCSIAIRFYIFGHLQLQNDPWTYRFFPNEIVFFLTGYLSYRLYLTIKPKNISKAVSLSILCSLILFIFLFPYLSLRKISFLPFSFKELFCFASMALAIPFLFKYFKDDKWDARIGELSYPVYICHVLIFMVCQAFFKTTANTPLLVAVISIALSYLLIRFIDLPVEKYRQSRLKKTKQYKAFQSPLA